VRDVAVKRLDAPAPEGTAPVVWLRSARECVVDGVQSPQADTLARVSGAKTALVRVVADGGSRERVVIDADVDAAELRVSANVTVNVTPPSARLPTPATTRRSESSTRRRP
jgi:hypothetical protein